MITGKVVFKLVNREETEVEWENHKRENAEIAEKFAASLDDYDPDLMVCTDITSERIRYAKNYQYVHYGPNAFLSTSGCAIFCIEHALRVYGNENIEISQLAEEAYKKGYLCEGKGTYHNIFDKHKNGFGRRAISYKEVFESLANGIIVTLLVNNEKFYDSSERNNIYDGRHFVNAIAKKNSYLILEDSNFKLRIIKNAYDVFKATEVAWVLDGI